MTPPAGTVLVEQDAGLRTLTLHRPGRLNGMDTPMLEALATGVRDACRDASVRAVLLTGSDGVFSAGGDPAEMTGPDAFDVLERWTEISAEVAGRIWRAEKPFVAAVDGLAVGAGSALPLVCDVVLLSDRASLAPVFLRRGLLPDHGLLWLLPRLMGLYAAKQLIFSGRTVTAAEALTLGLCTEVLPTEGFLAEARRRAADLAAGPTRALAAAKLVMNKGLENDLWTTQAFERLVQPALFAGPDFAEGFAAFAERRQPRFTGRWFQPAPPSDPTQE